MIEITDFFKEYVKDLADRIRSNGGNKILSLSEIIFEKETQVLIHVEHKGGARLYHILTFYEGENLSPYYRVDGYNSYFERATHSQYTEYAYNSLKQVFKECEDIKNEAKIVAVSKNPDLALKGKNILNLRTDKVNFDVFEDLRYKIKERLLKELIGLDLSQLNGKYKIRAINRLIDLFVYFESNTIVVDLRFGDNCSKNSILIDDFKIELWGTDCLNKTRKEIEVVLTQALREERLYDLGEKLIQGTS